MALSIEPIRLRTMADGIWAGRRSLGVTICGQVTTGGHGFPRRFDGLSRFRVECSTTATLTPLLREGASGIRSGRRVPAAGLKHARGSTPMRNGNSSSRAVKWFAIELPISYEGVEGSLLKGNGRTLAISSGSIQFTCYRNLPAGHVIRLWIQWPATLCDGTSLSLWATGTIQGSENCEVEVAIKRHEFRTRRAGESTPSISVLLAAEVKRRSRVALAACGPAF